MATHSNVLAWRIPWTEEPGGLQSMGCKESDTTEHACITYIQSPSFINRDPHLFLITAATYFLTGTSNCNLGDYPVAHLLVLLRLKSWHMCFLALITTCGNHVL